MDTWTIRRVLAWTVGHFEKSGIDGPRLTAELLLAHALATTRVRLYMDLDRPLQKDELARYRALIHRRVDREPTQYLTGRTEFYGRPFAVDPRVLIPRPETEELVAEVLQRITPREPATVLDLCTGSGCIALTVALERPHAVVLATDASSPALEVARANAAALGAEGRVSWIHGDLFAGVDGPVDVVVSNPPYVASGELGGLMPEVRREPRLALDGGPDGLAIIRRVVEGARARLRGGGVVALELGEDQGAAVKTLLDTAGYHDVVIKKDLAGHHRIALAVA